jgi:hypothetical protein
LTSSSTLCSPPTVADQRSSYRRRLTGPRQRSWTVSAIGRSFGTCMAGTAAALPERRAAEAF